MREIKFRGKALDGAWRFGDLVNYRSCVTISVICRGNYEVDPQTVGEFTGLQDAGGVDIYEGDICIFSSDIQSSKFVVVWNVSKCGFDCVNPNDKSDGGALWLDDLKVIGNIHDNPELLKEGD